MIVAVLVVAYGALLYTLLRNGQRKANHAVRIRRRRLHREFQRIQRGPRIAPRGIRKKGAGLLREFCAPVSVTALLIRHGTTKQRCDIRRRKWFQFKNAGARKQRCIDFKKRIFGCRADQRNGSVLHIGEQKILLPLVKAVYLVDKEGSSLAAPKVLAGFLNHFLHLFFAGRRRIQTAKLGFGLAGYDFRNRGFSAARRSVENHGSHGIRPHGAVQKLSLAEDMRLPRNLLQASGPHAHGKRRLLSERILAHIVKEVHQFSLSPCRSLKSR